MPVLVAPVAFQRMVDPEGEVAMARAAAAAGDRDVPLDPGDVAARRGRRGPPAGRHLFQLYCFSDEGVTKALMEQAVDSGFEAILLTVDAPRAGNRERDRRTGFVLPEGLGIPSVEAAIGGERAVSVPEAFELIDPCLGWPDLEALAADCRLPILVKGVHTAEDAALAIEHGAAGVVVSNHGGRQLDRVAATADVLEEAVEAVAGRGTVLVDGGIRRGVDVAIALALGADAVLVGRPALWGLAVGGEGGACGCSRSSAPNSS